MGGVVRLPAQENVMKIITRTTWAVPTLHGWIVYARSTEGYPYTVRNACEGFSSFREARYFAMKWASTGCDTREASRIRGDCAPVTRRKVA